RWQLGVVRKRQALQLEIIANQSQALSSQLNPRLIYNSLNSVLAKALENAARALIGFVARFAQLLRSDFEMSEHKLVPLAQELQVLKAYLQLESLRHGEHLRYHFNWESDADVPLAYLPPLLLQPLVENAIKYGQIDPEQGRSCEVSVSVQVQEQRLLLTVTDNGPGMPKERQPDTDRPSGLGIVRKRLQLLEEWLKAKTEFNITTDPTGTSIQLVLPLLQKIPPS
ncbi:MAG: sensor histidine kinase, partial [Salibacteraceae bacterium]